jgi:hypothetical protein
MFVLFSVHRQDSPLWNCFRITKLTLLRMFENRVVMQVLRPNRDEVTRNWSRLGDEELNDLYSLPNINLVIRSRTMCRAGYVADIGGEGGACRVVVVET